MIKKPQVRQSGATGWSMADECAFIDGLGQWREPGVREQSRHSLTRRQLLERYQRALQRRHNWGELHPATVLKYLKAAIRMEKKGVPH